MFSCTFRPCLRVFHSGPLFSMTFPYCSFIFKKLLFFFSSKNGLAVHLARSDKATHNPFYNSEFARELVPFPAHCNLPLLSPYLPPTAYHLLGRWHCSIVFPEAMTACTASTYYASLPCSACQETACPPRSLGGGRSRAGSWRLGVLVVQSAFTTKSQRHQEGSGRHGYGAVLGRTAFGPGASAARPYTPLAPGAQSPEPQGFCLFLSLATWHSSLPWVTLTSCCAFRMKRLPQGPFITRTSSPFTNPARPMTVRPTSPWSFWKVSLSVRP